MEAQGGMVEEIRKRQTSGKSWVQWRPASPDGQEDLNNSRRNYLYSAKSVWRDTRLGS